MSEHQSELLGAYVLGVLDPPEHDTVQQHLHDCAACRREVGDLREMESALGEVPPEALIEGPPAGADLLLQRTLRSVRAQGDRRRYALVAAAAAVALLGGAVAGRASAPAETPPPPPVA
ncbi:zf-HC2 domain-containing protein, partial [Actinoplanes sp. NPDC049596]